MKNLERKYFETTPSAPAANIQMQFYYIFTEFINVIFTESADIDERDIFDAVLRATESRSGEDNDTNQLPEHFQTFRFYILEWTKYEQAVLLPSS